MAAAARVISARTAGRGAPRLPSRPDDNATVSTVSWISAMQVEVANLFDGPKTQDTSSASIVLTRCQPVIPLASTFEAGTTTDPGHDSRRHVRATGLSRSAASSSCAAARSHLSLIAEAERCDPTTTIKCNCNIPVGIWGFSGPR
jgi:hypothetical protein